MTLLELGSIDSTNTYANRHFAELADGTLVSAEQQTAGRGRLGRLWLSPKGENIYVSLVMKQVPDPFLATVSCSVAVVDTLREFAPDQKIFIKWPNDVYIGINKIAGLLSEGVYQQGKCAGVITGMGININAAAESLQGAGNATSLFLRTGTKISLKFVLSSLAKHLEECYIIYLTNPKKLASRWKAENRLIGKVLEFITPDGRVIRSEFLDIDDAGNAVIEDGGKRRTFNCGDLRILKETLPPEDLL